MSCEGNGTCLQQCFCECYDDDDYTSSNEIPEKECTCRHKHCDKLIGGPTDFDIYCSNGCPHQCELVKCHNFQLCQMKLPQILLDCHNGMCLNCAISLGKITFLDEKDECPICMEDKDMIKVSCGKHSVCVDCWKHMSEQEDAPIPLSCPICRESIWKWKERR